MSDSPSTVSTLPVRVITPHTGLDGFRDAIRSIWRGWPQSRHLAWRFFLRDTRAAYRQSLFGYFWAVLPPLATTLVWVFLNKQDVVRIDSGAVPYPVFVLAGTILWAAFNGSLMAMMGIISEARSLLAKVNFPQEALIYKAFLKALLEAGIPVLLLVPALMIYGISWEAPMLLFPVALLATLLLGCALGLILVPIGALYTDVSRGAQLVLRFGFFLTPVIYALPDGGAARTLMLLNPVTSLIVSGRAWLSGSGDAMPLLFLAVVGGSILLLIVGIIIYKVTLPTLIERLSS